MKKIPFLFSLIFLLSSFSAHAVISITSASYDSSHNVTLSYSSTSGGNPTTGPVCRTGGAGCFFGIWVIDNSDGSARVVRGVRYVFVSTRATWAEANSAFLRTHPGSGTLTHFTSGSPPYSVCVGGAGALSAYFPGTDYQNQPGTVCRAASAPPVPTSCSFSGSPNIDHGTLQAGQVNGKRDSVSINVICNRATSATIASLGGTINLGGGVTSTLTFDGRSSGTISLPSGTSAHTVASTLKATNPTPGDKSGSGTIVINLL
ncbi:hypothetical protein IAE30_12215 [Pantoea sp. S61]|uniref:MrpH family fimbial adhesin n=1 Tax=Pantoea sp. S61 TaxID=2767442 RepID=UPI00190A71DF|nr:hypothetical protein [Pantoea sp. S61]MBK0124512.1 hypothetical protein [Pantoea sp. S61]